MLLPVYIVFNNKVSWLIVVCPIILMVLKNIAQKYPLPQYIDRNYIQGS